MPVGARQPGSDAEGIVLVAGAALIGEAALHQAAERALGLNAVTGLRQGTSRESPFFVKGKCWLLRNGSALDGSTSQVFEPQQHSEHSFELAVEMDLVTSKPLQFVSVERLAECLLTDQRPVGQFLLPVLEPRQHLAFEEAAQALDIGGGWLFAFSKFVWIAGERVCPPSLRMLTQCRQGGLVGVVSLGTKQFESIAGHGLIRCHVGHILLGIRHRGPYGIDYALRLAGGIEMDQRHLYRLAVGCQRPLQSAPMRGSLS